jgi:hypothetical protein
MLPQVYAARWAGRQERAARLRPKRAARLRPAGPEPAKRLSAAYNPNHLAKGGLPCPSGRSIVRS